MAVVDELLSVEQAALRLSVNPSRVRAMLASGVLAGEKIGGRWVVFEESLRALRRRPRSRGRQLVPVNAWAVLALASGVPAPWLSPSKQRYVRELMDDRGLIGLRPRLRQRAQVRDFYAHPSVLRRLANAEETVLTGASAAAAHGFELMSGEEVDAYVCAESVPDLVERWALEARQRRGNVVLRVVPETLWPFADDVAPVAAVALDLYEQADGRTGRIGDHQLHVLEQQQRWGEVVEDGGDVMASKAPDQGRRR